MKDACAYACTCAYAYAFGFSGRLQASLRLHGKLVAGHRHAGYTLMSWISPSHSLYMRARTRTHSHMRNRLHKHTESAHKGKPYASPA